MVILGLGAGALAYAVVNDDGGTASSTAYADGAPHPDDRHDAGCPAAARDRADHRRAAPGHHVHRADRHEGTTGTATVPVTSGFDTVTGPSPTTPGGTTTSSEPPTTDSPPAGASDWPAGTTAWTAILSSLGNDAAAQAAKTKLEGQGEQAGVLFSSDFPDLRPGYYVVFSGTYDARSAAVAQATKLRGQFPGAYARQISG